MRGQAAIFFLAKIGGNRIFQEPKRSVSCRLSSAVIVLNTASLLDLGWRGSGTPTAIVDSAADVLFTVMLCVLPSNPGSAQISQRVERAFWFVGFEASRQAYSSPVTWRVLCKLVQSELL